MTGRLVDIFPDREWISLTEAATALAFGVSATSEICVNERDQNETLEREAYIATARAAHRAAKEAGVILDIMDPSGECCRLPAVQQFFLAKGYRDGERERKAKGLTDAVERVVIAARAGQVRVKCIVAGQGFPQLLGPLATASLQPWSDPALDILAIAGSSTILTFVEIERASLIATLETSRPDPDDTRDHIKGRPSGKQRILRAAKQLWPSGIPDALSPGDRNRLIAANLKEARATVPGSRTFQRAFNDPVKNRQ